ncbi:peptidase S58 [Kordiimonadales bacterium JCM 17843]|nr:peptidase S58 [Kordiimonadales bacterium JCM 17843]
MMGVDVRGGAPGTRDTDALDPTCLVNGFHGLVLSGGSVFGLGAVDGVVSWLSERGRGLSLGACIVPVVPGAILFDLANGGDKNWGALPPYRALGIKACEAASRTIEEGAMGAGFGALAGDRRGGLGTAALRSASGFHVGALVAVNSYGPPMDDQFDRIPLPKEGLVGANTTIAAIATDLALDKAGCRRLAIMAQDGLARSLRPIHTPYDGDTVFALSTGAISPPEPFSRSLLVAGAMAADALARAVGKALAAAGQAE